jgi:oligosaccharide repeat unit polymerase
MIVLKKGFKNPATVFLCSWLFVVCLYFLRLSDRLYFDLFDFEIVFFVFAFFLFGWFVSKLFWRADRTVNVDVSVISKKNKKLFFLWWTLILFSFFEFFYFGYIPVLSMISGRKVSHFEFGIASLHGLVLAGYLFFSTMFSILYIFTKRRIYLLFILWVFLYGAMVMSRKLIMVSVFQICSSYFLVYPITLILVFRVVVVLFFSIMVFGFLGDIRTGNDVILEYGMFNSEIFEVFPGLSWVYIYLTTPVHNLVYAATNYLGEGSLFLQRTFEPLIPSVFSNIFDSAQSPNADRFLAAGQERYWLESEIFNVSTAFISPYIDNGLVGVSVFSIGLGFFSGLFYGRPVGLAWLFFSVMFMSAAALSIYSNNYTNLNFVGQFFWFFIYYYRFRGNLGRSE